MSEAVQAPDAEAAATAERRLHPMSWLFVLIQQMKQFILPLVALVLFGQGDRNELWPLIGVGGLALYSVWQYFTYRYGVAGDALVVRTGVFERSVRVIPFARIHNVALQQSLLHRLVGVAEVRLESAGGSKPEAEMRVLKLEDALALETLVRHRGAAAPAGTAAEPAAAPLLAMDTGEVLRLGLVSNRGLILLVAAFGGMWQVPGGFAQNLFEGLGKSMFGWAGSRDFGLAEYALAGLTLVVLAMAALRLLSMLLALLQYHGFELREHGRRLTVERGLLARWRTSASRRRIQAWTLEEGVLHRLLKRRSLSVDTAVAEEQQQQRALRELAPIATPRACDALVEHLLPKSQWGALDWTPQPARNWWRIWWPGALYTGALTVVAVWRLGHWGWLVLAWWPWSAFVAWQHARRLAWAINDDLVAVRGGWWSRHWRFAEIDKLQALQLTRNGIDRRLGTASLAFDTAGAGALAPPLRIRFLPEPVARELRDRLAATLAQRPLRW